jgi:alpha-beta hydrolase superfamily lysophospholipase
MCARKSASDYSLTWILLVDAVAKLKRARAAAAPVPIVLAGDDNVVPTEADLVGESRMLLVRTRECLR